MELTIRNKWISFGGSSKVQTLDGKDYLIVKGKFFTLHRRKFIKDLDGNTLFVTANRMWNFLHTQGKVFDAQGNELCCMRDKILSLHDHYNITSTYGNIVLRGNILGFNYHIYLNDKEVGHISRKISLRDSFVLTISDDVDVPFFVALVIMLDALTDEKREQASSSYN